MATPRKQHTTSSDRSILSGASDFRDLGGPTDNATARWSRLYGSDTLRALTDEGTELSGGP